MKISEVTPFRVEENLPLRNHFTTDENRARQNRKFEPHMARVRHHRMTMANIFSIPVRYDAAGQQDFDVRIFFKIGLHCFQRAGEILFIAVEIGQNVAGGTAITAIYGVIHAGIFFDKRLHALVLRKPVARAIIRTGILHDVFQLHALIGDGRNAQLEPRRIAEAGRDDGKLHASA